MNVFAPKTSVGALSVEDLIAAINASTALKVSFLTALGLTPAPLQSNTGIWNATDEETDGTPQTITALIARMKELDATLTGNFLPAPTAANVRLFDMGESLSLLATDLPYQQLSTNLEGLVVVVDPANPWNYWAISNVGSVDFTVEFNSGVNTQVLKPGETLELAGGAQ